MSSFKDDYSATLTDAVKVQRRFQRTLNGLGYMVAIGGSVVTRGKGKDIDVVVANCVQATISAETVATLLLRHSKRLTLYLAEEVSDRNSNVYMNFVTHDDLYVDVYVKGL